MSAHARCDQPTLRALYTPNMNSNDIVGALTGSQTKFNYSSHYHNPSHVISDCNNLPTLFGCSKYTFVLLVMIFLQFYIRCTGLFTITFCPASCTALGYSDINLLFITDHSNSTDMAKLVTSDLAMHTSGLSYLILPHALRIMSVLIENIILGNSYATIPIVSRNINFVVQ